MTKTLLLQGIKCQNKCDFASAGGQHINKFKSGDTFSLDLASEDHGTTFFLNSIYDFSWMNACLNAWESMICLCFECIYECMMYFLMFWMHLWMHDFMLMHAILTHMRFFILFYLLFFLCLKILICYLTPLFKPNIFIESLNSFIEL